MMQDTLATSDPTPIDLPSFGVRGAGVATDAILGRFEPVLMEEASNLLHLLVALKIAS